MIANKQTLQTKRRELEKLSHQTSTGNNRRCEVEVRFPAGARQ
jgi:hypothetical protein